jgi:hypothetical protein
MCRFWEKPVSKLRTAGTCGGTLILAGGDMPIVEIVAVAVIAMIVLVFAVVFATEVSQRRELRRLASPRR